MYICLCSISVAMRRNEREPSLIWRILVFIPSFSAIHVYTLPPLPPPTHKINNIYRTIARLRYWIFDRSEFCLARNHNMADNHKDATWDCTNTEAHARTCLIVEIADCLYLVIFRLLLKALSLLFWKINGMKSILIVSR